MRSSRSSTTAAPARSAPSADDPFEGYTDTEKQWIRDYDRLQHDKRDPARLATLRKLMAEQRSKIWHNAQPRSKGGDGHGWEFKHRRARFAALKARSL